jgi:hypothetical protein
MVSTSEARWIIGRILQLTLAFQRQVKGMMTHKTFALGFGADVQAPLCFTNV